MNAHLLNPPSAPVPRSKLVNADLARMINSNEVQCVVRPIKKEMKRSPMKLNPYAKTAKRISLSAEAERVKAKQDKISKKRSPLSKEEASKIKAAAGKAWYKTMISDSDYAEFSRILRL